MTGLDSTKTPDDGSHETKQMTSLNLESHRRMLDDSTESPATKKAEQKASEVLAAPSQSTLESHTSSPSATEKAVVQPVAPEVAPTQLAKPSIQDTSGLKMVIGPGSQSETQPAQRNLVENISKPASPSEAAVRPQEVAVTKPSPQSYLPESLTGKQAKQSDGSLIIPPIVGEHYDAPPKIPADVPSVRAPKVETAPQLPPGKTTFGELAAKLNQGDAQTVATPPKTLEPIVAAPRETPQPAEKPSIVSTNREAIKPEPNLVEQNPRRDAPITNSSVQATPVEAQRSLDTDRTPALQGRISNTADSAPPSIASRPEVAPAEKSTSAANIRSELDAKRADAAAANRSDKPVANKIDTIDARSIKSEGAVTSASNSGAIKSNRVETQSTDRTVKGEKTDAVKSHDDAKSRVETTNSTKREPLIIPGVITSRTSDNAGGGRGSKQDSKSDKASDTKNGGTPPDGIAGGKKDIGKTDKSGEKVDQHGETKIAATTSNVINGVAGRIAEGISNIKGMIIPGSKSNADSATDKSGSRVEHMDHLTQPKPMDGAPPISRDLKPINPTPSSTEFVINGRKEITDPREETLSSKAGGLKQALQQIFGNRPDIAADLKANEFPGPKTVPFESPTAKVDDKQSSRRVDSIANKSLDNATRKIEDPGYLRNQKGDKVPTGNLSEELAELKSENASLEPERSTAGRDLDDEDLLNRQKIKDFTVQLGEIAQASKSLPTPENFAGYQSSTQVDESATDEEEYDSRYLYYVKEGDTLRSIFDTQVPHEIGNAASFEYFVKINEQTIRFSSVLASDGMSLVLKIGTVLRLPTPKQLSNLRIV